MGCQPEGEYRLRGPWLSPQPRALTGDWAEQRNVQTSDLVGWTLKPSGLGGLLLPPGKALDQGNLLKKIFGAGLWEDSLLPGMQMVDSQASPQ